MSFFYFGVTHVRAEKEAVGACENTKQPPVRASLTFCDDYRASTCCSSQDTDRMLIHHVEMQRQSVSPTCAALYSRFECSKCDGRNLGRGGLVERIYGGGSGSSGSSKSKSGNNGSSDRFKVCASYAKQLYKACKEEYFVEGVGGAATGILTPCKSTDAICATLEEFSGDWREAVEMMGAEVIGGKKKSADDEEEEDEEDDEEDEIEENQSSALAKKEWCFDGSVPVFKKPKPVKKKPAPTKGATSAFSRLKSFRWKKLLTKRFWRRDQRLAKLLVVLYAFLVAIFLYKKNKTRIQTFFWKRRVENLRRNVANAAEMRMKSS